VAAAKYKETMMLNLRRRRNRIRACAAVLLGTLLFQTACGTLLYPERRGQTGGRIDPAVAIMNGLGLLLFLIPGIIAFAVDFSTGAIYLPPEEGDTEASAVRLSPDEMTPEGIATVIRERTGVEVSLTEDDVRVMRLESVEIARAHVEAAAGR
jgi:hypothetical protein